MSKHFSKLCFSVVMSLAFFIPACGSDDSSSDGKKSENPPAAAASSKHYISGKYESPNSKTTSKFYANKTGGTKQSSLMQAQVSLEPTLPIDPTNPTGPTDPTNPTGPTDPTNPTVPPASTENETEELVGKIEEENQVWELKGTFNKKNDSFSLSASGSILSVKLTIQITGTLKEGKMSNTKGTLKIQSGDDIQTFPLDITPLVDEEFSIDDPISGSQLEGLPSSWFGVWVDDEDEVYVLTSHQFLLLDYPDLPAGFLDIEKKENKFEMIWHIYVPVDSSISVPGSKPLDLKAGSFLFMKVWLEEVNGDLKLTEFGKSISQTYSETKKFPPPVIVPANPDPNSDGISVSIYKRWYW